ncbi:MAG TPA: hypothetical protein VMR34_01715 [Candidatus Saccharimonadales bacterium]|nr:hypothetical protein [Candidatus Saccharimonadales bacterium]
MKKTLFIIIAIIFLAIAVYYWVTPAGSLLHFVPGYQAGSTHAHLKHGLAALVLAVGSGLLAWFSKGSKNQDSTLPRNKSTD